MKSFFALPYWRALAPGLLLSTLLGGAATLGAQMLGGSALLYALLLGLLGHGLLHKLRQFEWYKKGIESAAKTVLRIGVALLGFRITAQQVAELGWQTAVLGLLAVASTIALGYALVKYLRQPLEQGLISGASVGICGASAALTVASVLPASPENERFTLLTVVGVTLLSTVAMVLYPLLAHALHLTPTEAGIFFGASIHDVAQVVGAGGVYAGTGSTVALDTATVVKLFRVVLLVPVALLMASLWTLYHPSTLAQDASKQDAQGGAAATPSSSTPLVPRFLLAFVLFMIASSLGLIPQPAVQVAGEASRWCLVVAIAAAGLKTRYSDIWALGWRPVALLLVETLWIACLALLGLWWMAH